VIRYRTIVADPPWRYNATKTVLRSNGRGAGAEHHYATMTNTELAMLDVAGLAEVDAHLYMWTTNPVLLRMVEKDRRPDPVEIVRAWGFEPKALITWVKTTNDGAVTRGGTGWHFRGATEHCIFAVRGKLAIPPADRLPNVVMAPRGRHSAKPAEFMALVEAASPGPYLEMFARARRDGWDAMGDELTTSVASAR
jgi:N6-adenosine-specific RNA methylase IME4